MKNKEIVYLSAPYTKGDLAIYIRQVIQCADELLELGYIPFVPHLNHLWHLISPKSWDVWLELDMAFLPKCDKLLRLDGDSIGADGEVAYAEYLEIPVYYGIEEIKVLAI